METDPQTTADTAERPSPGLSRETVEDLALELFAEFGFHASSMRAIAKHVGVRPASLYHWFPSKQALLVAIMQRFLSGLTAEVTTALEGLESPAERLATAAYTHVIYHGNNRLAAFVTDTEVRALEGDAGLEVMRMRDAYERTFREIVEAGKELGQFRVREPRVATYAILLECTGVASWFRPDGPLQLTDIAELHAEMALYSLRVDLEEGAIRGLIANRRD